MLSDVSGRGAQSAAQVGSYGMDTGASIAGLYRGEGQSRANTMRGMFDVGSEAMQGIGLSRAATPDPGATGRAGARSAVNAMRRY